MKLNRKYYHKVKTRTHILESALKLMGQGKSLDSLSLREVSREAGIVPGGFYRHFANMEEMGLAIVEEVSEKLRTILKEARQAGVTHKSALKESNTIFFTYVKENRLIFSFIYRERSGSNQRIRFAIRNAMKFFAAELASDLYNTTTFQKVSHSELEFVADFIITTMFTLSGEFLDMDSRDKGAEKKLLAKSVKQIRYIYRGLLLNRRRKDKVVEQ